MSRNETIEEMKVRVKSIEADMQRVLEEKIIKRIEKQKEWEKNKKQHIIDTEKGDKKRKKIDDVLKQIINQKKIKEIFESESLALEVYKALDGALNKTINKIMKME